MVWWVRLRLFFLASGYRYPDLFPFGSGVEGLGTQSSASLRGSDLGESTDWTSTVVLDSSLIIYVLIYLSQAKAIIADTPLCYRRAFKGGGLQGHHVMFFW